MTTLSRWNAAGTQVVNETMLYGYDTLGRLISASDSTPISGRGWALTYSYDGFGNMYNTFGTGMAASFNLNQQSG